MDSAVIDIGASNIEELLGLMRRYRGSHEDIDCFIVPAVPDLKQQQDTIATLVELAQMGVPPSRLKLVFNMVEDGTDVAQAFEHLLAFLSEHPLAQANPACRLGVNEIFARVLPGRPGLHDIASDTTDYKALIAKTRDTTEKLALARQLATRRLATGVVPELDACFEALDLRACVVA